MKRTSLIVVVLMASLSAAAMAQSAPLTPDQQQKRQLALDIVRIVNTAEQYYGSKHHRFANLDQLRRSGAFPKLPTNSPAAAALAASVGPDVGGFMMRLFLSPDAAQYTLMLRDQKDESLWSVFSDEEGLIYSGSVMR